MSNLSCGTHVAEPSANKDCRKLLNQFCRFLPKLKLPISADAKLPLTWDSKKQRFKQGCVIDGVQFNILNATIDTYIGFVDDYFNKASLREAIPTLQDLKQQFNYTYKQSGKSQTDEFFFVFQCFTALRYSDIKRLKHDNIREIGDGKYEIDILTKKDKDRIPFPLAKTATRIYKKYKDNLYDNGVVFPIISNQKYNDHLKKLGKLAELKGEWIDYQYKLDKVEEVKTPKTELTSHTARRTFVVTALNEGVELDLIAQITSHSDFDNMRPYIASTR